MLTVEFETEINNGTIKIPEKYRRQLKDKAQVVVRVEKQRAREEPYDILTELMDNPIQDPNFVPFQRDEIYDRKL